MIPQKQRTVSELIMLSLLNWNNISGTSPRRDFWITYAFLIIFFLGITALALVTYPIAPLLIKLLFGCFSIFFFISIFTLSARRLNETKTSIWWLITSFSVNFMVLFAEINPQFQHDYPIFVGAISIFNMALALWILFKFFCKAKT